MDEPLHNIGYIHKECSKRRKESTQLKIKDIKLEDLIGNHVKKAFVTDDGRNENMWVKVIEIKDDTLIGVLENDPFICKNMKFGDVVKLKKKT